MTDGGIGHNQIRSIVERIERVESEMKILSDDRSDIYKEAKSNGYNPKALRVVIRRRKQDQEKAAELEATVETYMRALQTLVRP